MGYLRKSNGHGAFTERFLTTVARSTLCSLSVLRTYTKDQDCLSPLAVSNGPARNYLMNVAAASTEYSTQRSSHKLFGQVGRLSTNTITLLSRRGYRKYLARSRKSRSPRPCRRHSEVSRPRNLRS